MHNSPIWGKSSGSRRPWLTRRGSGFIKGVEYDAAALVAHLAAQLQTPGRRRRLLAIQLHLGAYEAVSLPSIPFPRWPEMAQ